MVGLVALIVQDAAFGNPLPMFLLAAGSALSGVLLLPSAYQSGRRLVKGKAVGPPLIIHNLRPVLAILLFPLVLLAGYWVADRTNLAWLLLPVLHLLAVGLPVVFLLLLGVRDLPLGSPQRMWGVFGSGLALAPALILVAEGLAMLVLVVVSAVAIAQQPELIEQLLDLSEWLQVAEPTPEMILEEFGPYLVRPAVIFTVFAFGALIVPLIEEALKPIGVWLLVGRNLTPGAGFAAGALSGAGYAFFESLVLTSGGEEWAVLMAARVGTSVIHILTTGMMGWALVMAWELKRYGQLGLVYLSAVLIHGAWNALTLFTTYTSLVEMQGVQVEFAGLQALGEAAPFALGALAVSSFLTLLWANRSLAHAHQQMDRTQPPELPEGETSGGSML